MLGAFPMILIAVLLYNLAAFGGGIFGHHDIQALLDQSFHLTLMSGDTWRITLADLFVLLSLGLLFVEIIRAARRDGRQALAHGLAILVFCGALAEFVLLKGFATSAFFLIAAMCLFDVVAGYALSIVAHRRAPDDTPPDAGDYG